MKPNSDFNDIYFEFIFFDALKESHIRIMDVKIDDKWTSNRKLYQIQRKIKKRLKFYKLRIPYYSGLQIPGIKKIMKMILVLQENPEKLDEREKKAQDNWITYVKERERKAQERQQKQYFNSVRNYNKRKKDEKDKKNQETNKAKDLAVTPKENNYYKNHKKRKDEEKRVICYFNKKLDKIINLIGKPVTKKSLVHEVIKQLEVLVPRSDSYKAINVCDKWQIWIMTIFTFHKMFPNNELKNDITKMHCDIMHYKDQRNEKYSGRP